MSKITVKSTKEQMTSYLNEVFKSVQKANKNLADRIIYTSKVFKEDQSKVTKKDLFDLCKEAMALNLTPATPVVAEASVKPVAKKKVTKKAKPADEEKAETPTEEPEETPAENTEETPKAPAKASGKKKAVTKKSAKKEETPLVTEEEPSSKKEVPLAKMFKEKYTTDTLGTLEIAHDIKTMEDLRKAVVENEELLVLAMYWTPRHIKQFQYGSHLGLTNIPKKFVDDVDLASLVYIGEVNNIAYAVSSETDNMYLIKEADLSEEDGLRFAGGVEYQIYRQTAEPKEA